MSLLQPFPRPVGDIGLGAFSAEAPAVTLQDLTQLDVRVTWDEAVSIIEELCVAAQGLVMRPIPAARDIILNASGTVAIRQSAAGVPDPVEAARRLHELLGGAVAPAPLRLFVSQAVSSGALQLGRRVRRRAGVLRQTGTSGASEGRVPAGIGAIDVETTVSDRTHAPTVCPTTAAIRHTLPLAAVAAPAGPHRSGDRRPGVNRLRARAVLLAVGVFDLARGARHRDGPGDPDRGHSRRRRPAPRALDRAAAVASDRPSATADQDLVCARRRADTAHRLPGSEPLRRWLGRLSAGGTAVGHGSRRTGADVRGTRACGWRADGRGACAAQPQQIGDGAPPLDSALRLRAALPDADLLPERCHRAAGRADHDRNCCRHRSEDGAGKPVRLELIISPAGTVERARFLEVPQRMADMMLLSSAKTWQFTPAVKDGQPVRYRTVLSWVGAP